MNPKHSYTHGIIKFIDVYNLFACMHMHICTYMPINDNGPMTRDEDETIYFRITLKEVNT